jgi:hypothetical protein
MTCSVGDCDGRARRKGLCDKHYFRARRYGDPEKFKQIRGDDHARFIASYRVDPDGCWVWIKVLKPDGYGFFSVNGDMIRAHRYALADGKWVNS